jgi:peptidoglycan/LPS O-acetylase OafA/YrhL
MKVNEGTSRGLFSEINAIPPVLQNSYYPSLDGIRGVAIIMVVFSHLNNTSRFFYNTIFNGHLGVLIFFVLSGFLITTLCIKEKVINGDISLKNFYIRRALRIIPVAYLFILVIIVLNYFYNLQISYINIMGAVLYLLNFTFYFRRYYYTWYTGHFWSLAVEEQFYLITPFILKKNFKVFLAVILSIVFVFPLFVCLQNFVPAVNNGILYGLTHYLIKFHAIAVGCLFSVLMFKYPFYKSISATTKLITNIIAIALLPYIHYNDYFNLSNFLAGVVSAFLIGYIIVTNITPAHDLIFKLLNTRLLKIAGTLSYSIYVWQQIFTANDKRLPAFMVTYPYNIVCIIVVSCLSYYFYESFFLRLKSKFSRLRKTKTDETKPGTLQNISV